MNRLAVALGCAAIAAVSFAIGRATAPTVGPTIVKRAPTIARAAADQRVAPQDEALEECQTRLALAQGVLEALEHEKVGDPVPFPEDLPPQYTPEGFEDALKDALSACPGHRLQLRRVDCSEYPCMAFFTQPRHSWNHAMDELRACDQWQDRFGQRNGQGNDSFMTDDGVQEYSMVSVRGPDLELQDENASTRWSSRYEQAKEALMAELGGRESTPLEQLDQQIDFWRTVGDESFVPDLQAQRERLLEKERVASGER